MPFRPLQDVVNFLRRVVAPASTEAAADAELLARFINQRDENAFELLVWRHSKAVLAECYRVLRNESDAEDAFQATFLVFARKARSIRKGESLGGWLLKVAFRIALAARGREDKGGIREQLRADIATAPEGDRADCQVEQAEVLSVIDAEVDRLPEKYRLPIVLCIYQGKSNVEAAQELSQPLGTLQSNLSRGRDRLRDRLARRGVTLSAGLFAAAMTPNVGTAAVEPDLVLATVKGALVSQPALSGMISAKVLALVKSGVSGLTVNKVNWAAAVLFALVLVGVGVGWAVSMGAADNQPPQTQAPVRNSPIVKKQPIPDDSPVERARKLVVPKVLASVKGLAIGNRGDASVKSLRLTPDGKGIELQINWKHGFGDDEKNVEYESSVRFEYHLQTGECRVWVKDVLSGEMRRVQPHRAIVPVRLHDLGWEWAIRIQGLDDAVAAFEVLREPQNAP
jgi:RNA polymerase sigma factor (sigma-70 family)